MATCLNFNIPQVKKDYDRLSNVFNSEKIAYALMSQNGGFGLDKTPEGFKSNLFSDLLSHPGINNDENKALRYKAKIYTDSYLDTNNWLQNNNEPTLKEFQNAFTLPNPVFEKQSFDLQSNAYDFLDENNENPDELFEEASYTIDTPNKFKDLSKLRSMLSNASDLFNKHGLFILKSDDYIMELNAKLYENLHDVSRFIERTNEKFRKILKKNRITEHNVIATKLHDGKRWLVTTDDEYNKQDSFEVQQNARREVIKHNVKRISEINKHFNDVVGVDGVRLNLLNADAVKDGALPAYTVDINEEVLKDYNREMYIRYLNDLNSYFTRKTPLKQENEENIEKEEYIISPVRQRLIDEKIKVRREKAILEQTGGSSKAINELDNRILNLEKRIESLDANSNLNDIENEAKLQLGEVEKLLDKPLLTPSQIAEATAKIQLWLSAGDFSKETHVLLDDEERYNEDAIETLTEIKAKADYLHSRLISKGKDTTTNEVAKQMKDPDGKPLTFQRILQLTHKYGYFNKLGYSLNRVGHALAQFISKIVNEANDAAQREAKILSRHLADLYDAVKKSGFDDRKYYQVVSVQKSDGTYKNIPTGRLVHKFSDNWFKKRNMIINNKTDRLNKTLTLNPELLFDKTGPERDAHYAEIVQNLGTIEAEKYIARAEKLYNEFKEIRKEHMIIEFGTTENLTEDQTAQMKIWDIKNSPIERIKTVNETPKVNLRNVPGKDTFLIIIPRQNEKEGFYDHAFAEIENNPAAYAFYQELEAITNRSQTIFGHGDFTALSLSFIESTIMQKLMQKGMAQFLSEDAWDLIRQSFSGSTASITKIDPMTGKPVKELSKGTVAIDTKIKQGVDILVKRELRDRKAVGNKEPLSVQEKNDILVEVTEQVFSEMGFEGGTNIFTTINILNAAALSYRHLSMLEDTINLAVNYLPNSTMATGDGIIDREGNEVGQKYIQNLQDMVRHFLDTTYYKTPKGDTSGVLFTIRSKEQKESIKKYQDIIDDPKSSDEELSWAKYMLDKTGSRVTVNSAIRAVMNFIRLRALGWNFGAAFVNATYGTITNMYKAFEGRMFTVKDWTSAESEFILHNSKFNKVVENYGIVGDILYDFEEKNKYQERQNWFMRMAKALKPYAMTTGIEKKNQGTVMIAMMINRKVKNSKTGEEKSLWEAINDNGELSNEWELNGRKGHDAIVSLVSDIKSTVDEIHGDYRNNLMIKETMLGRSAAMFRLWFFEFFHSRFGSEKADFIRGIITKGRYRTAYELLMGKLKRNEMTSADKANMRANLAELSTIVALLTLKYLLKTAICGDDKECKKANLVQMTAINLSNRLFKDLALPMSAKGWLEFTKNPTSMSVILTDVSKLMDLAYNDVFGEPEDMIYQTGFHKDESKWKVYFEERIPLYNQLERAKKYGGELINLD